MVSKVRIMMMDEINTKQVLLTASYVNVLNPEFSIYNQNLHLSCLLIGMLFEKIEIAVGNPLISLFPCDFEDFTRQLECKVTYMHTKKSQFAKKSGCVRRNIKMPAPP